LRGLLGRFVLQSNRFLAVEGNKQGAEGQFTAVTQKWLLNHHSWFINQLFRLAPQPLFRRRFIRYSFDSN
jgi:hypothetical protein